MTRQVYTHTNSNVCKMQLPQRCDGNGRQRFHIQIHTTTPIQLPKAVKVLSKRRWIWLWMQRMELIILFYLFQISPIWSSFLILETRRRRRRQAEYKYGVWQNHFMCGKTRVACERWWNEWHSRKKLGRSNKVSQHPTKSLNTDVCLSAGCSDVGNISRLLTTH